MSVAAPRRPKNLPRATSPMLMPGVASLPEPLRWSFEEFEELSANEWFGNRRVMLIEGQIFEEDQMNPPHIMACDLTAAKLRSVFEPACFVRDDKTLKLGLNTDPRPDVYVLAGSPRDYAEYATTAVLIVEISDSTILFDLKQKKALYAAALIKDYWVLDVVNRLLHVFRDPASDSFDTHLTLAATDTISPLAAPTAVITVGDLLP